MAEYLQLSKRQPDLLREAEELPHALSKADKMHERVNVVQASSAEAPQMTLVHAAHELQTETARMNKTINQFIEEKRLHGGGAQADQMDT